MALPSSLEKWKKWPCLQNGYEARWNEEIVRPINLRWWFTFQRKCKKKGNGELEEQERMFQVGMTVLGCRAIN